MATVNAKVGLGGLPRRLVQDGVVDQETMTLALAEAQKKKESIVLHLVQNSIAAASSMASLLVLFRPISLKPSHY